MGGNVGSDSTGEGIKVIKPQLNPSKWRPSLCYLSERPGGLQQHDASHTLTHAHLAHHHLTPSQDEFPWKI
ncbi:hypothetical protein E2C01_036954 [Portunus trituberculatus]|uniref:Uncharacterized protein n=1 Tax=Portunus trituberculatus TaxID=210409 RepID=A0A5B7F6U8_PORTR|nr:hypothetical protein [Portunus trituberculatus]